MEKKEQLREILQEVDPSLSRKNAMHIKLWLNYFESFFYRIRLIVEQKTLEAIQMIQMWLRNPKHMNGVYQWNKRIKREKRHSKVSSFCQIVHPVTFDQKMGKSCIKTFADFLERKDFKKWSPQPSNRAAFEGR